MEPSEDCRDSEGFGFAFAEIGGDLVDFARGTAFGIISSSVNFGRFEQPRFGGGAVDCH